MTMLSARLGLYQANQFLVRQLLGLYALMKAADPKALADTVLIFQQTDGAT